LQWIVGKSGKDMDWWFQEAFFDLVLIQPRFSSQSLLDKTNNGSAPFNLYKKLISPKELEPIVEFAEKKIQRKFRSGVSVHLFCHIRPF
jgi:hypothetical protein